MFCSRPWLSFIKVLKLWRELSVITAEVSSASRCAADWPFKKDFYQIYWVCSIYFFYSSVKSSRLCYYGRDADQRTSTSLPLQWRRTVMSAWSTCKSLLSGIQSCRAVLKGCSTSECVCCSTVVSNIALVTVLLQSLVWKTGRRWARRRGQLSGSFGPVLFAPLTGEECCFSLKPTCT